MKAARLHEYHAPLKIEEADEPKATGPLDVVVRIGAAGLCRTDLHIQEGQWAEKSQVQLPYTPGHENAGWVHEVGSGGDERRGRRHRDRPPVHHLRAVPAVPRRRRHALRQRLVPRHQPRRRLRRLPVHQRALGRQARPVAAAEGHRGARRRRADRDPRGQEGDPGARLGHAGRRDRRRRARSHRDPVPQGDDPDRDHRRRPVRAGARARARARRRPHRARSMAPTSTPCRS